VGNILYGEKLWFSEKKLTLGHKQLRGDERGGIMQKFWVLIFLICLTGGCSSMAVNSSTAIGTDANGYAVGQYSDGRYGCIYSPSSVVVGGGGGGGGNSGMGLGAAWVGYRSGLVETQGDPLKFAHSIAIINLSRGYSRTSTADTGISRENIFTEKPLKQQSYQPFGHQAE
jgi:hypothetical protein